MTWMQRLYRLLQPVLFSLPAETAHRMGFAALRFGPSGRRWQPPSQLRQNLLGVEFGSPLGLAAGFDKDALCLRAWRRMGFGFAEVGTVTPLPQSGNLRPRLLRLREERSLQNWMGFNGGGVDAMRRTLLERDPLFPLGVNIGKNAATPLTRALDDYRQCAATIADCCDFLVVNVSSPNTPGLRSLQRGRPIAEIVAAVVAEAKATPVLVKLSPDEDLPALTELAAASVDSGAAGIVVNNTSVDYRLSLNANIQPQGGISGELIRERSRQITAHLGDILAGRARLISVGGIATAEDLYWRLRQGASLAEVYTGLVYEGPDLPRRLAEGLAELMERDGAATLSEVIGGDL